MRRTDDKPKVKPGITMMPKVLVTASPGTGSGVTVADALGITMPGRKKPSRDMVVPGVLPPAIVQALAPQPSMGPPPNTSPIVPMLQGNTTAVPGMQLPPGVTPFNPEGSAASLPPEMAAPPPPPMVNPEDSAVVPQGAADPFALQNIPLPPSIMEALAPPRRDTKEELKRVNSSLQMALLGNLISGGKNMPGNIAAALTGARVGNNEQFANAVQQYELDQGQQSLNDQRAQREYGQRVDVVESANKTSVFLAGQEADKADRTLREMEAKAREGNQAAGRKIQALNYLAGLATDADREAALAGGVLQSLGLSPEEAQQVTEVAKYQRPAPKTPAETALLVALRERYKALSDPNTPEKAAKELVMDIDSIQQQLGMKAGETPPALILNDLSPMQRAQVDATKKRIAETYRHNRETEAQGMLRIKQGDERIKQGAARIKQMGDRLKKAGAMKDNSAKLFTLSKDLKALRLKKSDSLNPDMITMEYEKEMPDMKKARGREIDFYTDMIQSTEAEIARLKGAGIGGSASITEATAPAGVKTTLVTMPDGSKLRAIVDPAAALPGIRSVKAKPGFKGKPKTAAKKPAPKQDAGYSAWLQKGKSLGVPVGG